MKGVSVSIIIVNFNTKIYLRECIKSILQTTIGISFEVIVIDNASSDDSVEMMKHEFNDIRLICNTVNNGFAKANNQGIAISQGKYLFFLNPDTLVLKDSISGLGLFLDKNLRCGIVGSKLYVNIQKKYHPSIRMFPNPRLDFVKFVPGVGFILKVYNKFILNVDKTYKVDWLCGAALMIRREVLDEIGVFDEQFFIYSEEADLCLRTHLAGYDVCYYPKSEVVHLGRKSADQLSLLSDKYLWESKMLYYRKYFKDDDIKWFRLFLTIVFRVQLYLKINDKKHEMYYRQLLKIINNG
ncbi:MAG: glycosyltransferase family 2 protein [Candidatus Pacebacteria bacterium]|nr:glycosyltransferase family 2 protein [Candidatus Paceibacterota bacterium]